MEVLGPNQSEDVRGDERGFTLIELLIVVIIIGILAGIAIPTYLSTRGSAYDADAQSTSHNAATAAIGFRAENRTFNGMNAEALYAIEPSLPASENAAPYNTPNGAYTITVIGGGSDFRIDVRHSQGSTTFQSTDDGNTIPLP